ncbi:hypothetical protein AB1285_14540 [Microbacterium sp. NRRL B-14842]|uniref:hypothetical protein n=1 Tax=Microbacterium sp. NRRL B-14842 TaxID=3162881 RepID=UPI0035112F5D
MTIDAVASSLSSSITQTWAPGKSRRARDTVVSITASSSRHGMKKCHSKLAGSPGVVFG